MADIPTARSRLIAVVAAVLVVAIAFTPTLLLGDRLSAFGLIVTGAILVGIGLLARAQRESAARTFGMIVLFIGVLVLVGTAALLVLLLGGLGRPV